nr:thiamine transporter 1-like [Leptinotarsa decemlineata]
MGNHFKNSFTNTYVIKWSLWYALSTCGFIQVQTYIQPLWQVIVNDSSTPIYNGAVEAVLTVFGFLGALLAGVFKADWRVKGELTLTICSLLQGFVLLYAARTLNVKHCYICYIAFGALYHFMITVASSEVAKYIRDESYGLVFGVNTFVALIFQSVLTAVVVTKKVGFALEPRDQYFVYGVFHVCIAVCYVFIGFFVWIERSKDYRKTSIIN